MAIELAASLLDLLPLQITKVVIVKNVGRWPALLLLFNLSNRHLTAGEKKEDYDGLSG